MITITGDDQFAALAARIRVAVAEYPGELRDQLVEAAKGVDQRARQSALETLPHRGGLAASVAGGMRIEVTSDNRGVDSGGATVTASHDYDISALNDGNDLHPLFGDKRFWYTEHVTPGWWDRAVTETEPDATTAVEEALETMIRQI